MTGMPHLPADVSRCVGRIGGLGPHDPVCKRRESCLRYTALLAHPRDVPISLHTPVHTALCRDGRDWMLEGVA